MANDKHAPPVQWAQRKDKLYLTLNVEDCLEPMIKFEDASLFFSGVGNKENLHYEIALDFFKEINPEKSKFVVLSRHIQMVVYKKDPSSSFWPHLLKEKSKVHWLKTDFDKWRDEDDSDADDSKDMAFEDMMTDMGSFKGAPEDVAHEEDDSDDEEMPDLE